MQVVAVIGTIQQGTRKPTSMNHTVQKRKTRFGVFAVRQNYIANLTANAIFSNSLKGE